jgi:hypothetical protein
MPVDPLTGRFSPSTSDFDPACNTHSQLFGYGLPQLVLLRADPTADGVAAPLGSLGLRQNGTAGELWLHNGTADTAWTKVA